MSGAHTAFAPGEVLTRPSPDPGVLQVLPPVVLAAAGTIIAFLGAVLLWRPAPAPLAEMTLAGAINVLPEHDVSLYVGSGVAFLVLIGILGFVGGWSRREPSPRAAVARTALAVAAAGGAVLGAVALFAHARNRLPAGPRIRPWELALFSLVALVLVLAAWTLAPRRPPAPAGVADAHRPPDRFQWRPVDAAIALAIVAVVYMPSWRRLAGNAFSGEELLHIDFFAMGPAVAFRKGLALGTDVHVYYGMGWALVLNKLPLIRTSSYGHFIRLEVIYGCIYFIAVYAFLRLFTRRWQWAVAGTALAIVLQLFGSYSSAFTMWRFPSATVLRWLFDIWFFLACLLYLRTRRELWLVVGGVLVGLGLLFQTDTGMYLGLAAGFFWCCLLRLEPGHARRLVRAGAVAAASGLAVLFLGLGIASRWTLTDRAFWDGWLENLRLTRAGATLQPLVAIEGQRVLIFFALMAATYLCMAGYTVLRAVHGRLSPEAALLGTIAFYGFFIFLYFVGRSNPHNLFRAAVPFAIVLAGATTVLGADGRPAGRRRPPGVLAAERALPWVAMVGALVMLLVHPGFRNYDSLVKTTFTGSEPDELCMIHDPPDICGIEEELTDYTGHIQALALQLNAVAGDSQRVAILDTMGPLVYSMADVTPWGRYLPMLPGLFFHSMVEDVVHDLESSPPDIVVMRSPQLRNLYHDDMWQALRPTVERGYTLDSGIGPFEVWKRRIAGSSSGRGSPNS